MTVCGNLNYGHIQESLNEQFRIHKYVPISENGGNVQIIIYIHVILHLLLMQMIISSKIYIKTKYICF